MEDSPFRLAFSASSVQSTAKSELLGDIVPLAIESPTLIPTTFAERIWPMIDVAARIRRAVETHDRQQRSLIAGDAA